MFIGLGRKPYPFAPRFFRIGIDDPLPKVSNTTLRLNHSCHGQLSPPTHTRTHTHTHTHTHMQTRHDTSSKTALAAQTAPSPHRGLRERLRSRPPRPRGLRERLRRRSLLPPDRPGFCFDSITIMSRGVLRPSLDRHTCINRRAAGRTAGGAAQVTRAPVTQCTAYDTAD